MKNKPEIIELFEDIYRLPSIAETIEPREKILLTAYCNELKNVDIHPAILILNPDYNYPDGCVTDDQKMEYWKSCNYEYQKADFVLNAIYPPKPKPATKQPETGLIWNITQKQIGWLFYLLQTPENSFIPPETDLMLFEKIFTDAPMEGKVVWLPVTFKKDENDNRYPNKKSLYELFELLSDNGFLSYENAYLLKWLPRKFKSQLGEISAFTESNKPKKENDVIYNSANYVKLKKIVEYLQP
jgi:hypothetical protein